MIPNHPYQVGQRICNIFWEGVDCQTVTDEGVELYLENGESKIFLPAESVFFNPQTFLVE